MRHHPYYLFFLPVDVGPVVATCGVTADASTMSRRLDTAAITCPDCRRILPPTPAHLVSRA